MFNWLKRRGGTPPPAPVKAAKAQARPGGPAEFVQSLPLPEVVGEGNSQADWSVWEDSVMALDSQMQDLSPSQRIYVRETRPSQLDELDPFKGVRRKRGG